MVDVYLYQGHASPNDVTLRTVTPDVAAALSVYLYSGHASPNDVVLRYSGELVGGGGGSTYNENLAETVTLSEALANLGIFSPGVAESVALSEAIVSAMLYTTSLSETLLLAEALVETLTSEPRVYAYSPARRTHGRRR